MWLLKFYDVITGKVVKGKYHVAAALQCVSPSIHEQYQNKFICPLDDIDYRPWDNAALERLQAHEGPLPPSDPYSWTVFSTLLEA